MTNPSLALEGVSYVLPNGRTLFSNLNGQFDQRHSGLVGRNGVGKTVLAGILSGSLQPSAGRVARCCSVHYLSQLVPHTIDANVASLACLKGKLDALERIQAGTTAPEHFEAVSEHWDIRQRLQQELERNGLGHLDASTPASALSGGEAMRVALIGAMLSGADYLILDEPSNHLDRPNRNALIEQVRRWPNGLLVISHDRQLLDSMDRILDLSSLGLQSYGGNYTFYAHCKSHERLNAEQQLEQRKLERRRQDQFMCKQQERQERRTARGTRSRKDANQAKILLDRQKERSESSMGKLRQQHEAARKQLAVQVRNALQRVEEDTPITVHAAQGMRPVRRHVAELDEVVLPFVEGALKTISLSLNCRQRVGVVGPNGCGKSTLLKLMAGAYQPQAGTCRVAPETIYLDQHLANLDPKRTVLDQVREVNRTRGEGEVRMRLAQLGLDAQKVTTTCGLLSGGERLKAALACVLYAEPPAQLLLLDEPSNHLDIPSAQALEVMLRSYQGGLIVVSHDDAFLNSLGLTDRLVATDHGWQVVSW